MLELKQIKLPLINPESPETLKMLREKIARILRINPAAVKDISVTRYAIDARRKPQLFSVFSAAFSLSAGLEKKLLSGKTAGLSEYCPVKYVYPENFAGAPKSARPVVIGFGPAGIFASYVLARAGLQPVILERGNCIEERLADVERFWEEGKLDPESNVQFGEGGAGTFSDGKLNTVTGDTSGRKAEILSLFVRHGAPESILYDNLPHVGTDILRRVITSIRLEIEEMGGEIHFGTKADSFEFMNGTLQGIRISTEHGTSLLRTTYAILAPGHSARDTFTELKNENIPLEQKDFAVGLRVMHPQAMIDRCQYGESSAELRKKHLVPAAPYKLTARASSGRGVYSFCMCPGGYVVNASSEPGRLAVNGMSYSGRNSGYANSAIVVTVGKKEFGSEDPLAGMIFQRKLEEKCYSLAEGDIPVESFHEYDSGQLDGSRLPDLCIMGKYRKGPLHDLLPADMRNDLKEGMHIFEKYIPGFSGDSAFFAGLESRTSSPVRIVRDSRYQAIGAEGLFPCGEGAGYAGGIMSAAMDGMKTAEAVCAQIRSDCAKLDS